MAGDDPCGHRFVMTGNSNLKNSKTDYDWRVGQMLEATV